MCVRPVTIRVNGKPFVAWDRPHTHTRKHACYCVHASQYFESAARATAMKRGEGWVGFIGVEWLSSISAELSMYQPHSVALNRFYVKTALTRGGRTNLRWPCLAARHTLSHTSTHNSPPQNNSLHSRRLRINISNEKTSTALIKIGWSCNEESPTREHFASLLLPRPTKNTSLNVVLCFVPQHN